MITQEKVPQIKPNIMQERVAARVRIFDRVPTGPELVKLGIDPTHAQLFDDLFATMQLSGVTYHLYRDPIAQCVLKYSNGFLYVRK